MADAFGQRIQFASNAISISYANMIIDASSEKVAWVFQVPAAITITRVIFRYGARTGTPPTHIASLQALSTSGRPDGTVLGGGSPASVTFTPPADATWNSTTRELTLDNGYSATKGQFLALVVGYSSGTIDGSNNSTFTSGAGTLKVGDNQTFPFALEPSGSSYAVRNEFPFFGIGDGTNYYGWPVQTINQVVETNSGRRLALRFMLPSGHGDTFKVRGLKWYGRQGGSAEQFKIGLWEGTTEKQADTYDTDFRGNGGGDCDSAEYLFTTPVALSYGTAYYCGVENVGGASSLMLNNIQAGTAAHLTAFPGGSEWYYSTFNGTAWSDDTTRRPLIDLILDDVTEPAGGGGGTTVIGVIGE